MNTVQEDILKVVDLWGNYIQLGGLGIMDGLKIMPNKRNLWRIEGIAGNGDLLLRGYRKRYASILPRDNQGQEYKIITRQDYKNLPVD